MKKIIVFVVMVVCMTVLPLAGIGKEPVIELKIAHWSSPESKEQEIMKAGADWLEKRFPGRVKVNIYPSSTLLGPTALYEGIYKGIADIALVVPQWTPGRFPKSEIMDLPPAIPSAVDATNVYWDFFNKFLADEWKEVKVISLHVQVPQAVHTKSKSIKTFEDLKGQKMRVYGIGKDVMKAFGGVPVSMPMSEAYEAIRQGVVSGIMVPFSEMKGYRLLDVTNYHTEVDSMASPFLIIMNKRKWESLPADMKQAFDKELTPYWNKQGGTIWDRWEADGKELVKKTKGHEYIIPSPAEKKQWREKAMSVNDAWAAALEAKGLPGKKLLEEKYKAISKYIK
jgi:TRAP-type C4-dicarboxylate transport system substrate-binding protein